MSAIPNSQKCCAFSITLLTWWQTPLITVNAWNDDSLRMCVWCVVCHVSLPNASHGCQQAVIPRHRDKPLYNTVENVGRCCQINFPTFQQTDQVTGGQPWHSHTLQCPLKQLHSQGRENMAPMDVILTQILLDMSYTLKTTSTWQATLVDIFPHTAALLIHINADEKIKMVAIKC